MKTMTGMEFTIDPHKAYPDVDDNKLLASTGLLPYFAAEVSLGAPKSVQEAFEAMMQVYGFGMGQDGTGWGTVDSEGVYKSEHEEDPDMSPLVSFHLTDEVLFHVYQYAICAITDGEETMMMRMD